MSFNYNLLKPLRCLLETRSVNDAAAQLNTTPSAVSRTLRTLREVFQDELLTRKNGKMELTAKAVELQLMVSQVVRDIESLNNKQVFIPALEERNVTIALNASIAQWFAPLIVEHLKTQAPNLKLIIDDWSDSTPQKINDHLVDYAIHYFPLELSKSVVQKRGLSDYFVLACRKQHPMVGKDFQMDHFNHYPMAVHIMKHWNEGAIPVCEHIKKFGIQPNVALRTTHLAVLLKALQNNDLLFPCSIHLAQSLAPQLTYLTSSDPDFQTLRQREFGFLYDKTKSNDPFIHWLHCEIFQLMDNTIRQHATPEL